MAERATGITVKNPTDYVATQLAAEQAEGHSRVIQIISVAAGKIESGSNSSYREVSSDDSYTVTTVSGNIDIGDNAYLSCYIKHSDANGSCLVTPLLCNSEGAVLGHLDPRISSVGLPVASGSYYLAPCLTWNVMSTGAWKLYPHISKLSAGNSIQINSYTF
jgi:hypothetical protein